MALGSIGRLTERFEDREITARLQEKGLGLGHFSVSPVRSTA